MTDFIRLTFKLVQINLIRVVDVGRLRNTPLGFCRLDAKCGNVRAQIQSCFENKDKANRKTPRTIAIANLVQATQKLPHLVRGSTSHTIG